MCRPHPQAAEGDFTFVTIIHLIGFQLSGRGSGGCVCVHPPSFSAHQRERKKTANGGSAASEQLPAGRRTGLVRAPGCYHPSLSGACGSNPTYNVHGCWSQSISLRLTSVGKLRSQGKGAWRSADASISNALWALSGTVTADLVPVYWLHGCV